MGAKKLVLVVGDYDPADCEDVRLFVRTLVFSLDQLSVVHEGRATDFESHGVLERPLCSILIGFADLFLCEECDIRLPIDVFDLKMTGNSLVVLSIDRDFTFEKELGTACVLLTSRTYYS